MTRVVALTEAPSWFAYNTDLPQLPLREVTPEAVSRYQVAVLCPEKFSPKPIEIIGWKRAGLLPDTRLCFGSFKGLFYWSREREQYVDQWMVHCRSEIERCQSTHMTFIPLSYPNVRGKGEGQYIFCGGRAQRDYMLAAQSVVNTGMKALFVCDVLPQIDFPNIECRYERVPGPEYCRMIANAWCVLVPSTPGLQSHGHSDVVRALVAGRPVIVTKGASCDDYITDGVNGYLVAYDVDEWTRAILRAWEQRKALTEGAIASIPHYEVRRFNEAIHRMVEGILAARQGRIRASV